MSTLMKLHFCRRVNSPQPQPPTATKSAPTACSTHTLQDVSAIPTQPSSTPRLLHVSSGEDFNVGPLHSTISFPSSSTPEKQSCHSQDSDSSIELSSEDALDSRDFADIAESTDFSSTTAVDDRTFLVDYSKYAYSPKSKAFRQPSTFNKPAIKQAQQLLEQDSIYQDIYHNIVTSLRQQQQPMVPSDTTCFSPANSLGFCTMLTTPTKASAARPCPLGEESPPATKAVAASMTRTNHHLMLHKLKADIQRQKQTWGRPSIPSFSPNNSAHTCLLHQPMCPIVSVNASDQKTRRGVSAKRLLQRKFKQFWRKDGGKVKVLAFV